MVSGSVAGGWGRSATEVVGCGFKLAASGECEHYDAIVTMNCTSSPF